MGLVEKMAEELAGQMDQNSRELGEVQAAATTPSDSVRAFDQYGREVMVPRDEWRTNVIPNMLKEAWDNPDQLYVMILNSLTDGFAPEMLEAGQHLAETDTVAARGACMYGNVLMQLGRRDEAKKVFEQFTAAKGEDGSILVNLARLYAEEGEAVRSMATLERAVEIEPNHDNGLGWLAAQANERGGEAAVRETLEKIAASPLSWRAQLWLARGELSTGNLDGAKALYGVALDHAPKPLPADFLMQVSGDLGSRGHLMELIEFTGPHFVPEWHGLPVGNNLIKALVDTNNLVAADQVKAALYALNRPDWKDALAFWDIEIARVRTAQANTAGAAQEIQIGMLRIDGPIWSPPGTPGRALFSEKSATAPKVTFLGGTAEAPEQEGENRLQLGDAMGRMTRSLPLFFAEQVQMRTAAAGRAMVPWAVGASSGFVVSGQVWPDATAVEAVRVPENLSDYVVTVHLDAEVEPWTAMLTFIRTSDGTRIGELQAEFSPAEPEKGLPELADEVVELLSVLGPATASPAYELPGPTTFGSYLLRLEQMLAVRCAAMDGVSPAFLNGEREILQGGLDLCLAEPANVPARLLLSGTYDALRRMRPEIEAEFAEKMASLRQEYALKVVDSLFV